MSRKNKKENIVFENIEVLDAGAKGVSVAKTLDGRVIFIPNVVPGDVVDVKTFKKRKSYFEGKAIRFHQYSQDRIAPVCQHFGDCGGCKWQNMSYDKQLFYKNQEVYNNIKRITKFQLYAFEPIIEIQIQLFYLNERQFSFSNCRRIT